MKFKLFGCEIYVSFLFCALITLMLLLDRSGLILPTLTAVFLHELGHLLCMYAKDIPPKRIKLIISSVQITTNSFSSYKNDITVSLCGPIANLMVFIALFVNYTIFKNQTVLLFSFVNLIIAFFNLLPLKGLDGGRIIYCIVAKKSEERTAERVLNIITISFSLLLVFLFITLCFKEIYNPSLLIIPLYFIILCLAKK